MNILSIETATEACSAGLMCGDECTEVYALAPRQHTQLILSQIDQVLSEAGLSKNQLDGVCFSRGPGAFTGVRIGTATTQAIAVGLDLPVVAVSTLAIMAQAKVKQSDRVVAAIDARMSELYIAEFNKDAQGLMQAISTERVLPQTAIQLPKAERWLCCGSGFAAMPDLATTLGERLLVVDDQALPHAIDALTLARPEFEQGKAVSAEQALPVYIRDQVVQTPRVK